MSQLTQPASLGNIPEELAKVKTVVGTGATYDRAAKIVEEMSTSNDFSEALALSLYEEI